MTHAVQIRQPPSRTGDAGESIHVRLRARDPDASGITPRCVRWRSRTIDAHNGLSSSSRPAWRSAKIDFASLNILHGDEKRKLLELVEKGIVRAGKTAEATISGSASRLSANAIGNLSTESGWPRTRAGSTSPARARVREDLNKVGTTRHAGQALERSSSRTTRGQVG